MDSEDILTKLNTPLSLISNILNVLVFLLTSIFFQISFASSAWSNAMDCLKT